MLSTNAGRNISETANGIDSNSRKQGFLNHHFLARYQVAGDQALNGVNCPVREAETGNAGAILTEPAPPGRFHRTRVDASAIAAWRRG